MTLLLITALIIPKSKIFKNKPYRTTVNPIQAGRGGGGGHFDHNFPKIIYSLEIYISICCLATGF